MEIAETKGGPYFRRGEGWRPNAMYDTIANTWTVTSEKITYHSRPGRYVTKYWSRHEYRTIIIDDKTAGVISRKKGKQKRFHYPD